jgi:hypothetical protein
MRTAAARIRVCRPLLYLGPPRDGLTVEADPRYTVVAEDYPSWIYPV